MFEKIKQALKNAKRRIADLYLSLKSKHRSIAILSTSLNNFRRHRMYLNAGYFAYSAFLSLFALLLLLSSVLGTILHSSPALHDRIMSSIYNTFPDFGGALRHALDSMTFNRELVGIIGLIGLLWTGTRVFNALEKGFSQICGGEIRKFMRRRLLGVALIVMVGVLFSASLCVHFGYSALFSSTIHQPSHVFSFLSFTSKLLLSLATGFLLFLILYLIIPIEKLPLRAASKGAGFAAVLFLAIQYVFTLYFLKISRVTLLYGTIAAFIGILIWLHLIGIVIFLGIEVAATETARK